MNYSTIIKKVFIIVEADSTLTATLGYKCAGGSFGNGSNYPYKLVAGELFPPLQGEGRVGMG